MLISSEVKVDALFCCNERRKNEAVSCNAVFDRPDQHDLVLPCGSQ